MNPKASELIVIATAKAKAGKEADLERALREVAGPAREQPGCVQLCMLRSLDDRGTMVGFERWVSVADHQRHMQGAHVQRLMGRLADLLAEPPSMMSYEVIDA